MDEDVIRQKEIEALIAHLARPEFPNIKQLGTDSLTPEQQWTNLFAHMVELRDSASLDQYGDAVGKLDALGAETVPALIEALKAPNSTVRNTAALLLGARKDPRSVEPLIGVVQDDENLIVRSIAAGALGDIGDPRAVEPLIAVLRNATHDQTNFLEDVKASSKGDPLAKLRIMKRSLSGEVIGPPVSAAAEALGQIGNKQAVEPLIELLQTEDNHNRTSVVKALAMLGDNRSIAPLQALRDSLIAQGIKPLERTSDFPNLPNPDDPEYTKKLHAYLEKRRAERESTPLPVDTNFAKNLFANSLLTPVNAALEKLEGSGGTNAEN